MIQEFKEYMDELEKELEDKELSEDDLKYARTNLFDFGKIFVEVYPSFSMVFRDITHKKCQEFLKKLNVYFNQLLVLFSNYNNASTSFSKARTKKTITLYMSEHYDNINSLINIYSELTE